MKTEWLPDERRAALHAALGDPVRLRITDLLLPGDRSSGDLRQELDLSSNLLAHHLAVLERAGLITRSRSEGDRRRSYIRLRPALLAGLAARPGNRPERVVFVCTGNSARSPLAAAIWARTNPIPATSAGTHPALMVSSLATTVAARHHLDLSTHAPRSISGRTESGDLLITLCDRAHEMLRDRHHLHWSVPNPGAVGTEGAYECTYQELRARISVFADHLAVG